jgi:methionyl-tRNA synthetase
VDTALARFDVRGAATAIWDVVAAGNRIVTRERPWELAADDPALADLLTSLVHACRTITTEIEPFLPDAAPRLRARLGEGDRVGRGEPVFPRLADRIGAASGGGRF